MHELLGALVVQKASLRRPDQGAKAEEAYYASFNEDPLRRLARLWRVLSSGRMWSR